MTTASHLKTLEAHRSCSSLCRSQIQKSFCVCDSCCSPMSMMHSKICFYCIGADLTNVSLSFKPRSSGPVARFCAALHFLLSRECMLLGILRVLLWTTGILCGNSANKFSLPKDGLQLYGDTLVDSNWAVPHLCRTSHSSKL